MIKTHAEQELADVLNLLNAIEAHNDVGGENFSAEEFRDMLKRGIHRCNIDFNCEDDDVKRLGKKFKPDANKIRSFNIYEGDVTENGKNLGYWGDLPVIMK